MDLDFENSYPTPFANTTILPLLVLSLYQQQKHSPTTNNAFKQEYDYIIVGAGSAGSTLAGRLSEVPCASVLLLEAGKAPPILTDVPQLGPYFYESDIAWGYKTVPQKHAATQMVDNQVLWPSGKTLGGSSILNGMLYVRGNRRNYDMWAEQGAVGWSADDVWPYFLKMEGNTEQEFIENGHHYVGGPVSVEKPRFDNILKDSVLEAATELGYEVIDSNGAYQTGFYDEETTTRNGQRCSTAKAYLVPAENRTNLDIVTNAFVQKVLIKEGRAVGVRFEREGESYDVTAKKEVILSAGTVNSAQLLMLSGIGPKEHLEGFGIDVVADLPVGDNFHDHCGTYLFFEMNSSIPNVYQQTIDPDGVQDYIDNRRGILSSSIGNPLAFLSKNPDPETTDFPEFQIVWGGIIAPSPLATFNLKPEVVSKFEKYLSRTLYTCFPQFLQPKSRGTVRLNSADPFDPPLIDPNYYEAEEDVQTVVDGLKVCLQIGNSPAMQKLGSKLLDDPFPGCEGLTDDEYLKCLTLAVVGSLSHQVGSAKMGDVNDPTTVVDPRLKVKGIEGLRVVDASIMPIVPSANTNVPTIMVAEKAADIIKNTLNCPTQTAV